LVLWLGLLFYSLGADVWKHFSLSIALWPFERDLDRCSLVFTFESDHLDAVMLLHSVLWISETGSCKTIWTVQETSATGQKLVFMRWYFLAHVTTHTAQLCTCCGWFIRERGSYYITVYCHSPVEKLLWLGLKSCMSHHLYTYEKVVCLLFDNNMIYT